MRTDRSGTISKPYYSTNDASLTISCGPRDALRTAFWIIAMVVRHPRSSVSFRVGSR